jgi:hypothetical protein
VRREKARISMERLNRGKKSTFMALAALAMALAIVGPGQAWAMSGHGGDHSGSGMRQGFDGHHGFDRHHDFDRGRHHRFGFGGVYPYYGYYPPVYGYQAPAYWYYCPSYEAYYPSVTTCPEAWVPVPAS